MNDVFISAEMSMEGPKYPGGPGRESSSFSGGSGVSVKGSAPGRGVFYILLQRTIGDAACGVQWGRVHRVGSHQMTANILFLLHLRESVAGCFVEEATKRGAIWAKPRPS
jgi:hypothetical protein